MIMNCGDRSNRVQSITKTREDNNVIDRIGAVYAKNDTELWWSNGSGVVYDENQIEQWRD